MSYPTIPEIIGTIESNVLISFTPKQIFQESEKLREYATRAKHINPKLTLRETYEVASGVILLQYTHLLKELVNVIPK